MRNLLFLFVLMFPLYAVAQTDTTSWEELYNQGKYYREHSNSFRAMQFLEQAESLHSSDTVRRELALTYFNRGHYQKCIDLCRSVLYPDTLDSDLYLMARSFERMEKKDSALWYQILVADRNIENYSNLVSLCNMLIDMSETDTALSYLDSYCAVDSTNAAVNSVRALALHKAGKHDAAVNVYESLKAEGDDRSSTNFYLGLSYYLSKNQLYNFAHAYDLLYRAAEQTERKNPAILLRLAVSEITMISGYIPFRESILTNPEYRFLEDSQISKLVNMQGNLSLADKAKQINDEGLSDLEKAIELMQPDQNILFYIFDHIGNGLASVFRLEESVKFYDRARKIQPTNYNLYYKLAIQYYRLKDYKNEMHCFEKYIEYAPKNEDPDTLEYAKEQIAECKKVLFMKGE